MENLSSSHKRDTLKLPSLCRHHQTKARMKRGPQTGPFDIVWKHAKFRDWYSQQGSALIMVKGDYNARHDIKALSVSAVELLRQRSIPVVWVLESPLRSAEHDLSAVDIVKDLIYQTLRFNISSHSERSLSLSCARFRAAETPAQWFDLLASIIESLPSLCIIIDIEAVDVASLHGNDGFSWLSAFSSLLRNLSKRRSETRSVILCPFITNGLVANSKISLCTSSGIFLAPLLRFDIRNRGLRYYFLL